MWLNRTICDVFEEIRQCVKNLNFGCVMGLIEEAQSMANRMEAKLNDISDWKDYNKKLNILRKEVKELEERKEALEEKLGDTQYEDF